MDEVTGFRPRPDFQRGSYFTADLLDEVVSYGEDAAFRAAVAGGIPGGAGPDERVVVEVDARASAENIIRGRLRPSEELDGPITVGWTGRGEPVVLDTPLSIASAQFEIELEEAEVRGSIRRVLLCLRADRGRVHIDAIPSPPEPTALVDRLPVDVLAYDPRRAGWSSRNLRPRQFVGRSLQDGPKVALGIDRSAQAILRNAPHEMHPSFWDIGRLGKELALALADSRTHRDITRLAMLTLELAPIAIRALGATGAPGATPEQLLDLTRTELLDLSPLFTTIPVRLVEGAAHVLDELARHVEDGVPGWQRRPELFRIEGRQLPLRMGRLPTRRFSIDTVHARGESGIELLPSRRLELSRHANADHYLVIGLDTGGSIASDGLLLTFRHGDGRESSARIRPADPSFCVVAMPVAMGEPSETERLRVGAAGDAGSVPVVGLAIVSTRPH